MLLTDATARGVARGEIGVVVRRWATCRVRAGSTLRTTAGVIAIETVDRITVDDLDQDDATGAGYDSVAALRASLPRTEHPVFRIRVRRQGPDPRDALAATAVTADDVDQIDAALGRLDARSRRGRWTHAVLETVAAHPARRAADLAAILGRDTASFKLDVRTLKNLGLTESLDVGYRLAPRGASYLAATARSTS